MTDPMNITGPALRHYRTQARLSYAALSRLLREKGFVITPRRLKRMEEQTCKVYVHDLVALSRALQVSVGALLDE